MSLGGGADSPASNPGNCRTRGSFARLHADSVKVISSQKEGAEPSIKENLDLGLAHPASSLAYKGWIGKIAQKKGSRVGKGKTLSPDEKKKNEGGKQEIGGKEGGGHVSSRVDGTDRVPFLASNSGGEKNLEMLD